MMNVKIMNVLDEKNEDMLYGIKIQLSTRRAIFIAKGDSLMAFKIKQEAEDQAIEVKAYLEANQNLEDVFRNDKTIKVIKF